METTLRSRITAQKRLSQGNAVGIFPGGGISTVLKPLKGRAHDLAWVPFTAKLIRSSRAIVVPVYFPGQNSRLFQLASHVSETLRLSLLFRETARRIGTRLDVAIGNPIPYAALAGYGNRADMLMHLRRAVFALARDEGVDWMTPGRLKSSA
jgi:putative hemolysin